MKRPGPLKGVALRPGTYSYSDSEFRDRLKLEIYERDMGDRDLKNKILSSQPSVWHGSQIESNLTVSRTQPGCVSQRVWRDGSEVIII